jgi:superfamily II DNA or RNA helicase
MLLSNRVGFNNDVYNKYHPIENNEPPKYKALFPEQKFISKFIQPKNPYRGLLIYFGLGTGKTRTAINTSEIYIEKNMKVITMMPASIASNYEKELLKYSRFGKNLLKSNWFFVEHMTQSELSEYGITNNKKKNWISAYKRKSGDTTTIVHTEIEYKNADSTNLKGINESISLILQHKYNFIKYNGITKSGLLKYTEGFFSNALIIIDEAHNFIRSFVNNSTIINKLYGNIINAKNSKILLLSGTPLINKPFELSALINLVKGPTIQYEIKLNDNNFDINVLKDNKYIDEIKFKKNVIYIELTPHGFVKINNKIIQEKWINSNEGIIQNMIEFLIKKDIKVDKKYTSTIYNPLPHTESEFNTMFVNSDNNSILNEDMFIRRILGAVSYFRRANDDLFPVELKPIFRYIDMSDFQLQEYSTERTKELMADAVKKKFKNADVNIESTYRAFSRMLCNFVFPTDMNRPYPSDIRKELATLIENEKDDTTENDIEEGTFNIKKAAKEQYNKQIEEVINLIKKKTDLDIAENSPKFVQMIKDMNNHNKVLVYSQFRNIGGLGIFKLILERNNWIELNIEMKNQSYSILNHEEVLKSTYKRFIIFNEDRAKTKELMNIYNGNFKQCAPKIQEQLKEAGFKNNANIDNNIDGKVINTMMITQSGAEGISLTNVRAVLIMEPYWNNVRIEQVIGRAIRTNSHENLPKEDRNVQVYHYLMKGSKEQLEGDIGKTLKLGDNGLTTDEFIQVLSNKKTELTSTFLIALKKAAVDCSINALINKKDYKCYAFPINLEINNLANTANIEDDRLITLYKNMAINKKIKGTVVKKNNIKYVKFENNIYDYKAYIEAELLIPVLDH